jgi:hypothetical protein
LNVLGQSRRYHDEAHTRLLVMKLFGGSFLIYAARYATQVPSLEEGNRKFVCSCDLDHVATFLRIRVALFAFWSFGSRQSYIHVGEWNISPGRDVCERGKWYDAITKVWERKQ